MAEILVVEQEMDIGNSIVEILERKGHRTALIPNGLEALGEIYAREYDLVLLGLSLPGIDGPGLVDAMRKNTPGSMAIMVSGGNDFEKACEALKKGAYDVIEIPEIGEKLVGVVESALREAREMGKSGYIYKDHRENYRSLITGRAILTATDSLLAGLTFLAAFAASIYVMKIPSLNLSVRLDEIPGLSLGVAFCYAFSSVFRRSYRFERVDFGKIAVGQIWRNITAAYLVFLGTLFLSGNLQFLSGRAAVLPAYGLGFLSIIVSRRVAIPFLHARFRREGEKRIVIMGSGKREPLDLPFTFGRMDSMNPGLKTGRDMPDENDRREHLLPVGSKADQAASSDDREEIYIDSGVLSSSEILSLLNRHRGRRLKITPRKMPVQIRDEDSPGS
jgi:CheY-like chemotaxis protein